MTYAIQNIERILLTSDASFIEALDELQVSRYLESAVLSSAPGVFHFAAGHDYTYVSLLLQILLPFVSARAPSGFTETASLHIGELQSSVLRLVILILGGCRNGNLVNSLQPKDICLMADVVRAALDNRVETGEYGQTTSLLLDLAMFFVSQRIEGLPDIRAYGSICSIALKETLQADVLRSWAEFVLKGASASIGDIDQLWMEFLDPQLKCLSEKLAGLRIGPLNPLLVQATIGAIEQIGLNGLAMIASTGSEKTASMGQVRSKPRRFESFKNALLVRSSTTASPSSPGSNTPDPQVQVLVGIFFSQFIDRFVALPPEANFRVSLVDSL